MFLFLKFVRNFTIIEIKWLKWHLVSIRWTKIKNQWMWWTIVRTTPPWSDFGYSYYLFLFLVSYNFFSITKATLYQGQVQMSTWRSIVTWWFLVEGFGFILNDCLNLKRLSYHKFIFSDILRLLAKINSLLYKCAVVLSIMLY